MNLPLLAYPGDPLTTIWSFWYRQTYADYSLPIVGQLLYTYLCDVLTKLTGEVATYNFVFLGSLALAFFLTYKLSRRATINKSGSLTAALIYAFSQDFLWRGSQNLEMVLGAAFLPLFVQSLLFGNIAAKVISLCLVILSSFYLGYFCLLLSLAYIFINLVLCLRGKSGFPSIIKKIILPHLTWLGLCFILTLPATYSFLQASFSPSSKNSLSKYIQLMKKTNTIDETFRLTARPWDFFLPSEQHPLFGQLVKKFYEEVNPRMSWQLWSAYLPERAIFWGWTATLLALLAICTLPECNSGAVTATKASLKHPRFDKLPLGLLLFSLWLSLPPYFSFRGYKVPFSPSYFLVQLFPVFRAYIRINFFTKLFLALLAGQGLSVLIKKWPHPKLAVTIISALIIFENLTFIPRLNVNQLPPLYAWLKGQPANILVAEYPQDTDLAGGCDANLKPEIIKGYSYTYSLNFQRLHQHQLLKTWELPQETQKDLWDLNNPAVYRFLKNNGVTHILAHTTDYFAQPLNPFDQCQNRRFYRQEPKVYEKFTKEATFPDGIVYRLL